MTTSLLIKLSWLWKLFKITAALALHVIWGGSCEGGVPSRIESPVKATHQAVLRILIVRVQAWVWEVWRVPAWRWASWVWWCSWWALAPPTGCGRALTSTLVCGCCVWPLEVVFSVCRLLPIVDYLVSISYTLWCNWLNTSYLLLTIYVTFVLNVLMSNFTKSSPKWKPFLLLAINLIL